MQSNCFSFIFVDRVRRNDPCSCWVDFELHCSLVRTDYGDTGSFNDLAPGEFDVLLGKTKCDLLLTVEMNSPYQVSLRVAMGNTSRLFSPTVKTPKTVDSK